LSSVFRLSRALLPAMASRNWGRVMSIGSILGQTGATGMGPYSAAKAGLVGLTKALALEFSPAGVTVNCVAPGYIRTPMMDMNPPETLRALLARIPVGFFGSPEDVAGAVLYLASSEARFVTGSTLHINGGMEMS
jgi:3-oxoacyl-[acyl-carrier protein] reductase